MTPLGRRILANKYEILREIKKGGFGIVYYGIDNQLNKPVAIKEIAPSLLEDPKCLEMFHEEALNVAKLSHNNIVHIYEFSKSSDGRLYIIMEYIDGKDLEKIIRVARRNNRLIPPHLTAYLIAEICSALDYAHQRRDAFTNRPLNLVHQDISPSNIMVSRYGGVKLIDFGIAAVKRHQTKGKRDRKLRGKIPYMSPEQLLIGNQPDHRSDLFSLGLVMYEALCGARLFNAQEDIITAGKNPKWVKKMIKARRLPTPLEKILLKALEVDIARRYQTANHMYLDLLQYLISCNKTGELMDELAAFVNQLFQLQPEPTPGAISIPEVRPSIYESPGPASEEWSQPQPVSAPTLEAPPVQTVPSPRPAQPAVPVQEDPDEEDDIKTVIDVLRLSARNNKKRLVQFGVFVLLAGLIFGLLDTLNGWTRAGTWMYDLLFPPAIEIVTVPPNATVLIDEQEIPGRTPVAIDKIAPGVHKLRLELTGYKPIVKSLFVPREGTIRVQGEHAAPNRANYLFRFNTEIALNSEPPGAVVYLNGVRFNQKTPCTFTWEVGKPLDIELEHPGFERLTGFSLNTLEGFDEVEDRRLWRMSVNNSKYKNYSVTGIFRKPVTFNVKPNGVEIYDAETQTLLGVAGAQATLSLRAGTHALEFRKNGFLPKSLTLTVDETSRGEVDVVLSRTVRVGAYDQSASQQSDLGAQLVYLRRGNRDVTRRRLTTPFEITLPAYAYRAKLQKAGYEPVEVVIGEATRSVRVAMEALKSAIAVQVLDALSNQPLADAEIYYNRTQNPFPNDRFLDQTNRLGEGRGQLQAGEYRLTVRRRGYNPLTRTVTVAAGEERSLVFKLFVAN